MSSVFPFKEGFDLDFQHSCCTLCWHAFDLQDSLPEKKYYRRIVEIIAQTLDFGNHQKTLTYQNADQAKPAPIKQNADF
jgi:hypothetical protein